MRKQKDEERALEPCSMQLWARANIAKRARFFDRGVTLPKSAGGGTMSRAEFATHAAETATTAAAASAANPSSGTTAAAATAAAFASVGAAHEAAIAQAAFAADAQRVDADRVHKTGRFSTGGKMPMDGGSSSAAAGGHY